MQQIDINTVEVSLSVDIGEGNATLDQIAGGGAELARQITASPGPYIMRVNGEPYALVELERASDETLQARVVRLLGCEAPAPTMRSQLATLLQRDAS